MSRSDDPFTNIYEKLFEEMNNSFAGGIFEEDFLNAHRAKSQRVNPNWSTKLKLYLRGRKYVFENAKDYAKDQAILKWGAANMSSQKYRKDLNPTTKFNILVVMVDDFIRKNDELSKGL